MAHLSTQSAYGKLISRLNRAPQGAPRSELLLKILQLLFNEKEAALVSVLLIRPLTIKKAARLMSPELPGRSPLSRTATGSRHHTA